MTARSKLLKSVREKAAASGAADCSLLLCSTLLLSCLLCSVVWSLPIFGFSIPKLSFSPSNRPRLSLALSRARFRSSSRFLDTRSKSSWVRSVVTIPSSSYSFSLLDDSLWLGHRNPTHSYIRFSPASITSRVPQRLSPRCFGCYSVDLWTVTEGYKKGCLHLNWLIMEGRGKTY